MHPPKSSRVTARMPFDLVRFDPVRSADPPTVNGTAALTTSSAISLALRVATFGRSRSSPAL